MNSCDSLEVFLALQGHSFRSRYLAFLMLEGGLFAASPGPVSDGVKALAKRFGCSPASYTRSVQELVSAKLLIQGKQPTKGRPILTYSLNAEFATAPYKGPHAEQAKQSLLAASAGFTIPERVLLADLWLGLICKNVWVSAKSCVVDGVSIRVLSKRLGQGKATIHRVIGALEAKGFIFSDRGSFNRLSRDGVSNTYYLLGPVSTQGMEVVEWDIEPVPKLVRFLASGLGSRAVSDAFSSRILVRSGVLDSQLAWLESDGARVRLIRALCVAFSNHPSWSFEGFMNSVLLEAERFLLRESGFESLVDLGYRGLENMDFVVDHQEDELFESIKLLSGALANAFCFMILLNPRITAFLRACKEKQCLTVRLVEVGDVVGFKAVLVRKC